jgi:hypothetical protein
LSLGGFDPPPLTFVGWHAPITPKWLLHHLVVSIHFLHRCQHASITLQRLVFSFAQHNNTSMRYVPLRRTHPSWSSPRPSPIIGNSKN